MRPRKLCKPCARGSPDKSQNICAKDVRGHLNFIDERQITHLIRVRLKYDLYDFFRGVLGLLPVLFLV